MNLVAPEFFQLDILQLDSAEKWPVYFKFVAMISAQLVAIGPANGILHGDLLLQIRNQVEAVTQKRLEFSDKDVVVGHVQFAARDSFSLMSSNGKPLEPNIAELIGRLIREVQST